MTIVSKVFATPIYQYENVKNITTEENNIVRNEIEILRNEGNSISTDKYILERPEFADLKKVLLQKVNNYFQEVYAPKNKDLELYITQSWLTYTSEEQYHHKHFHSNSIAAGVFYFSADKTVDKIFLEKDKDINNFLEIPSDKPNEFNSKVWSIDVDTNMLVIFPATVNHGVQLKQGDNLRISLPFNTFVKGTIGSNLHVTELIL